MSDATDTDTGERKERQRLPDFDRMSEEDIVVLIEAAVDRLSEDGLGSVIDVAQEKRRAKAEAEREGVLRELREKAAVLGMRIELFPMNAPSKSRGRGTGSVAPKYRSPDGQSFWTGRGRPPKWMEALIETGRKKEEFLIT